MFFKVLSLGNTLFVFVIFLYWLFNPSVKIMITGGIGFISSYLCSKLLYGGNEMICVDNLFSGRMKSIVDKE